MSLTLKIRNSTLENKGYHILFVDDCPVYHKYLELLVRIKKLPIIAHYEYNAKSALAYLENCSEKEFPDVIMTDVAMPSVNGFQFIEQYLKLFKDKSTLLFVTSSSEVSTYQQNLNACTQIDGFIEKPLSINKFRKQVLEKLILKQQVLTNPNTVVCPITELTAPPSTEFLDSVPPATA